MKKFYYLDDNEQKGPVSIDELKSVGLRSDSLVWTEGLDKWTPVREIEELRIILMTPPPPTPSYKHKKSSNRYLIALGVILGLSLIIYGSILISTMEDNEYQTGQVEKELETREVEESKSIFSKIELVAMKTGYYEYKDLNSLQVLYQPMVILKFKNISNNQLSERIEMKAVFIRNDEEKSNVSKYFQSSFVSPLQSGLSRQIYLQSSVGWTSYASIEKSDYICQIYIDNELYKTVNITNRLLTFNLIQDNDRNLDFDINETNFSSVSERETTNNASYSESQLISENGVDIFRLGERIPFNTTKYTIKKETEKCTGDCEGVEEFIVYGVYEKEERILVISLGYDSDGKPNTDKIGTITVLSNKFKTKEGVGVGSSIEDFVRTYPDFSIWYTYISERYIIETELYRRFQFELDESDCLIEVEFESYLKLSDFRRNSKIKEIAILNLK